MNSIDLTSGVSLFDGSPFVNIVVIDEGKVVSQGQLSPTACREHGQKCFEAAEAAETDALVWAMLKDIDMDEHAIGAFLTQMRERRSS
jgi:hypothetical protein